MCHVIHSINKRRILCTLDTAWYSMVHKKSTCRKPRCTIETTLERFIKEAISNSDL